MTEETKIVTEGQPNGGTSTATSTETSAATSTETSAATSTAKSAATSTEPNTEPLTMEAVKKMLQSETDKVRTEYTIKLKEAEEAKKNAERKLMSKEEREAADAKAKDELFKQMETELLQTKMEIKTTELLKQNELPIEFKNFLIGSSEEVTVNNVNEFKKVWQAVIKSAVEGKFKEGGRDFQQNNAPAITKEEFNKMTYRERNKLFQDNPELYKQLSKL